MHKSPLRRAFLLSGLEEHFEKVSVLGSPAGPGIFTAYSLSKFLCRKVDAPVVLDIKSTDRINKSFYISTLGEKRYVNGEVYYLPWPGTDGSDGINKEQFRPLDVDFDQVHITDIVVAAGL